LALRRDDADEASPDPIDHAIVHPALGVVRMRDHGLDEARPDPFDRM
jgi:hypothetical protein